MPEPWALEVGGLVRKPLRLTLAMLQAMPGVTYTVKHHCVEGWTAIGSWTGVPVSAIAELVRADRRMRGTCDSTRSTTATTTAGT